MTRGMAVSLPEGMWRIGALLELPRDMHCSHQLPPDALGAAADVVPCSQCREVLAFMEELRVEAGS